jgi:hypothetical protein
MFRFLFALVLIATPFLGQAQKIEGLVKGKDTDLPIRYAIISVIDADSLIIAGELTDTLGYFMIDELLEGSYVMSVSAVGYESISMPIEMDDNHFDFDPLFLTPKQEEKEKERK